MKSLRSADITTGALLFVLGAVCLVAALQIPGTAEQRLKPGVTPTLLSWLLIVVSSALLLDGWRRKGEFRPVDWPDRCGVRALAVTTVSLLAYLAALEPVGFPVSSAIFGTFLCWYLGRGAIWKAALIGIACGLVILILFIDFLRLGFPLGILESVF